MRYVPLLLTLTVTACMVGGSAQKYPLALQPAGASARVIMVDRRPFTGELLAVQDSSLLLRTGPGSLQRVPLAGIAEFTSKPGSVRLHSPHGNPRIAAATLERLRLVSRYPYGVTPEILAQLGGPADSLAAGLQR